MRKTTLALLTIPLLLLTAAPSFGQSRPAGRADDADVRALAADIDRLIEARWKAAKAKPAAPATDAEYLRRTYLDLLGRVPSITEVRDFLDDPAKDKRFRLVSALLSQDRYPTHMAAVWRATLLAQANDQFRNFGPAVETWLRQRIKDNTPYDEMVRGLLNSDPRQQGALLFSAFPGRTPEELAAATARAILS